MKLTKCPNGHFYDAEKFPSCPHCNGNNQNVHADDPTSPINAYLNSSGASDYTQPIYSFGNSASKPPESIRSTPAYSQSVIRPQSPVAEEEDDDKTMGFMSWGGSGGENGSDPQNVFRPGTTGSQHPQTSPVVGWLVCTEGASYGKSFNLYAGQNFIGRSKEMDISLSDPTVSRNRHAIIIYEPIHRQFYAQTGESHELFYVNGSVVLTSTPLKDHDVISIGSVTFMFVPFCDERFGWIDKGSPDKA